MMTASSANKDQPNYLTIQEINEMQFSDEDKNASQQWLEFCLT